MRKIVTTLLLFSILILGEQGFPQCETQVICILAGPPVWIYTYSGTGAEGYLVGFAISPVCNIHSVSSPIGYISEWIPPYTVLFYSHSPLDCGPMGPTDFFSITAPLSMNGYVDWEDPWNDTKGITFGPYCIATYTPTPTRIPTNTFTVTSTFTLTNTPTPSNSPTFTLSPTLSPTHTISSTPPVVTASGKIFHAILILFLIIPWAVFVFRRSSGINRV